MGEQQVIPQRICDVELVAVVAAGGGALDVGHAVRITQKSSGIGVEQRLGGPEVNRILRVNLALGGETVGSRARTTARNVGYVE